MFDVKNKVFFKLSVKKKNARSKFPGIPLLRGFKNKGKLNDEKTVKLKKRSFSTK